MLCTKTFYEINYYVAVVELTASWIKGSVDGGGGRGARADAACGVLALVYEYY